MGNADGPHTRGIADGIGADLTVADADRTGAGRPDAGQDLQQFALAVAADPGNTDDFAGAQGQVDIAQAIDTTLVTQADAARLQLYITGLRWALVEMQAHLAADHQFRQFLAVGRRCRALRHHV